MERARRTLAAWEEAVAELEELDARTDRQARALHVRQVTMLAEAAAHRELAELVETGLLPEQALASSTTPGASRSR